MKTEATVAKKIRILECFLPVWTVQESNDKLYLSDYKTYFPPPQIWEENGGAFYSPSVAYLVQYRISALKDVIKYFTTVFASKFFSYLPPLKPSSVLWSKKYGYLP